jgi:hypothetical protein
LIPLTYRVKRKVELKETRNYDWEFLDWKNEMKRKEMLGFLHITDLTFIAGSGNPKIKITRQLVKWIQAGSQDIRVPFSRIPREPVFISLIMILDDLILVLSEPADKTGSVMCKNLSILSSFS